MSANDLLMVERAERFTSRVDMMLAQNVNFMSDFDPPETLHDKFSNTLTKDI